MTPKKRNAAAVVAALLAASVIGAIVLNPFGRAEPQSLAVVIRDQAGNPLANVSVQGFLVDPAGDWQTVFLAVTPESGRISVTNLTIALEVAQAWVAQQGEALAALSSPVIVVFLTYTNSDGLYFQQSSFRLTTVELLSGLSSTITVRFELTRPPVVPGFQPTKAAVAPVTEVKEIQPPPCAYGAEGSNVCWMVVERDGPYPSSPGPIPTVWLEASGLAYGAMAESILSSTSTDFNIGFAIGPNLRNDAASAKRQAGGTIWTLSSYADFGQFTPTLSSGQRAHIYVNGRVEGVLFQSYSCGGLGCFFHDLYQYDVGVINIAVSGGHVVGGYADGAPAWINLVSDEGAYSYGLYQRLTGTGSGLPFQVYSSDLVNTYANSDTTWINVAVSVGAILVWAFGPAVAIPRILALSLVGTVTSETLSATMAWVQYNGASGQPVDLNVYVSTATYQLSNGLTGPIPLMGVQILGWGDSGGCVAEGTPILAPQGYLPVQELRSGDAVTGYDLAGRRLITLNVLHNNMTREISLISINDGDLLLTAVDHPIYARSGSFEGWVRDPKDLKVGDMIFRAEDGTWVVIETLNSVSEETRVYELVTDGPNNFIANGFLLDEKEP